MKIERLVIERGGIDLEIAGMDDDAERSGNGQSHTAHGRMGHVDELDAKWAGFDDLLGVDWVEARIVHDLVLLQPPLH